MCHFTIYRMGSVWFCERQRDYPASPSDNTSPKTHMLYIYRYNCYLKYGLTVFPASRVSAQPHCGLCAFKQIYETKWSAKPRKVVQVSAWEAQQVILISSHLQAMLENFKKVNESEFRLTSCAARQWISEPFTGIIKAQLSAIDLPTSWESSHTYTILTVYYKDVTLESFWSKCGLQWMSWCNSGGSH